MYLCLNVCSWPGWVAGGAGVQNKMINFCSGYYVVCTHYSGYYVVCTHSFMEDCDYKETIKIDFQKIHSKKLLWGASEHGKLN